MEVEKMTVTITKRELHFMGAGVERYLEKDMEYYSNYSDFANSNDDELASLQTLLRNGYTLSTPGEPAKRKKNMMFYTPDYEWKSAESAFQWARETFAMKQLVEKLKREEEEKQAKNNTP